MNIISSNPVDDNYYILIPQDGGKDRRHRLRKYAGWLDDNGYGWAAPDLRQYRDYLLDEEQLAPESVAVHLSTVRARYREILLDRQLFFSLVPTQGSFSEQKALVDELISRIENAINPRSAPLSTRRRQDRPDSEQLRLTHDQARELLQLTNYTKPQLGASRDKAIIALLLCTGIREGELCSLEVGDLEQQLSGQLALHVRLGKGKKERMVPYGAMHWGLSYTRQWLRLAQITEGPVFRGLRKGDNVRKTPINERTIQKILGRYPIQIDGRSMIVRPHDCRRTYARWLYMAGVKADAIQKNLGHESIQMTFRYIGDPDVSERLPPDIFHP
ncbi:tyrosine-type recombinase/integrase [Chloroflexota bacterium]